MTHESTRARLALENGRVFEGKSCGAQGEATGELCFNTSMTGYQEMLTDPSYAGQILTLTVPHVGNVGTNRYDNESRGVSARGLVVRSLTKHPSSFRSEQSLPDFLRAHGVIALEGIDTRELVRVLREEGALKAIISTGDESDEELIQKARESQGLNGVDWVKTVSVKEPYNGRDLFLEGEAQPTTPVRFSVVALDSGIKFNIVRELVRLGCDVTVVPVTTSVEDIKALNPDGVFLGNGPGDPDCLDYYAQTVRELLGYKPLFGICLGHQMLSRAVGAKTYKLKYGHRGANHPVKDLTTGKVEITSQNHGYCVDFSSIGPLAPECAQTGKNLDDLSPWALGCECPVVENAQFGPVALTHVNLNDMTVEGISVPSVNAFSVQYHPEASAGPHDAHYLFARFLQAMQDLSKGDARS